MKRSSKFALVACTLVLASLFQVGAALACTEQCVRVAQFCRQCQDVGTWTGATCQSSGSCGCFYTQNTCGLAASGIKAQDDLASVVQKDKTAVCSADSDSTQISEVDIFLR
jgi:hypothetical protein